MKLNTKVTAVYKNTLNTYNIFVQKTSFRTAFSVFSKKDIVNLKI